MSETPKTMRAVHFTNPGPASGLRVVDVPIPVPKDGQVLIRVKAFGLNRSELITRMTGMTPIGAPVTPGRVLGIEAAGIVEAAPGSEKEYPKGATALTAVGGMGIFFDGGYAQYACVPKANVQVLKKETELDWATLGALPEMLQTAHGALFRSLKLKAEDILLVRGGTTSVGLTAVAIAKGAGATVVATTRHSDEATKTKLKDQGADHVVTDEGTGLSKPIKELFPDGVTKILELVGAATLLDSLPCLATDGLCCVVGVVGGTPVIPNFNPLMSIQTGQYLTAYGERNFHASNLPLDDLVSRIEEGALKIRIGKVFDIEQIVEAHELMEKNEAVGKIVVMTGM